MGWITVNGNHIFVPEGQTPRQAVGNFIASKKSSGGKKTTLKKPSIYSKGRKVQVQDPYSGNFYGDYKITGKMNKNDSARRYGTSVTGYNLQAQGYFAKNLKKNGLDGKATSNNARMKVKATKYTKASTKKVTPTPVSHISVNTSKFYGSHLKNPKGSGNWAFDIGGKTVWKRGTFAQAKKEALKEASKKGLWHIDVLP